jgi:hypothetical protein
MGASAEERDGALVGIGGNLLVRISSGEYTED